ncbi:hypothetical protein QTN47_10820 [Danxiaibacter flavus]|uniref:Recombinase n=1 Tax=Danxiaibacter flavus TaxID=3049108 RepID=A0ABV3ZES1_9BACT|nr:hypothetical protein QNM32_10825 [Chitinophagaceae bacterium DXS]
MLKKKKKHADLITATIEDGLELRVSDKDTGLNFLVDFFKQIRPKSTQFATAAETRMQTAIQQLHEHPSVLRNLQAAMLSQLINTNLIPALTESGVLKARGFVQELVKRINHKFLPALQDENDFLYVINRVFYKHNDYVWVERISTDTWQVFFETLGVPLSKSNHLLQKQLFKSLIVLSYKIVSLSYDHEVHAVIPEEYVDENPFIEQNNLSVLITELEAKENVPYDEVTKDADKLDSVLDTCLACLQQMKETQAEEGASLSLTYTLLVMETCLNRMKIIVASADTDQTFHTYKVVDFFIRLIRNEKRKNSIRELSSQSLGYIAYRIAEHKGIKGNKYITSSRREYNKMIISAMWGGLIICFTAVFKNLLTKVHFPPFWAGVAYSVNYSLGFLLIEHTHSSLATKQPAFTASALAESLDNRKNDQPNLYSLAITVSKVMRSQVASFFGNLIIVFPGSYLLAWLYELCTHKKIVEGAQAMNLLEDQHPWHSLSLAYAMNTGVFLFISGLLAGFVQNKIQYGKVKKRLERHPVLTLTMKKERRERFAAFIDHYAGSIAGNVALGFFLGMAGLVPKIFGIPFDIRHITISAANTSIGIYGVGFTNLTWQYILVVILGVLGIGFINFLVSFSLAFIVAVKSRGIKLREYPEFLKILLRYFKKYPMRFIRPGKGAAKEDTLAVAMPDV